MYPRNISWVFFLYQYHFDKHPFHFDRLSTFQKIIKSIIQLIANDLQLLIPQRNIIWHKNHEQN